MWNDQMFGFLDDMSETMTCSNAFRSILVPSDGSPVFLSKRNWINCERITKTMIECYFEITFSKFNVSVRQSFEAPVPSTPS